MLDAVVHGFTQGLANYVQQQRELTRQREDTEYARQLSLLDQLRSDPRTTPATMGKVLHDMLEMSQGQQGSKSLKSGKAGFLGAHEMPASQLLTHIAQGTIPIEYTGSPSGQAMLQGLVQSPPTADPMMAHSPMNLGGGGSAQVPPPPAPSGGLAAAQGQPQAEGGMVGATSPQTPSPDAPSMSPPPPEPPGTAKMAGAAGPLQADMATAPKLPQPPQAQPSVAPNLNQLMSNFGHQHTDAEQGAVFYSPEHMYAMGEAQKYGGAAGQESGKLDSLIQRYRNAKDKNEQEIILRQAGIIPSYQRTAVMVPNDPNDPTKGTHVVLGVASRKMGGGYEDEAGNPLPGAVPWTSGMVGTATGSQGDTVTFNKANPGAGSTVVPGTQNVLAGSKIIRNVQGPDGKPMIELMKRDGTTQFVASEAIKDQYIQEDDGQGHMILKIKPTLYQGGGRAPASSVVPPAPSKGAAPTSKAPRTTASIPPPPAAPMKNDKGKLAQPGDIVHYGKLNVQDEQSTVAVTTALPEIDKAMKLLEDSGLDKANDWKNIIKSKLANKVYSDWGIKPSDLQADIFQRVGYARAHLLRGLIGARMPVEIAHIIDEHLAKGSQSPALMYHQLRLLREEELPTKLQTIYDTSRVEPPSNVKRWLKGPGGGDDALVQHLLAGLGKNKQEE